MKIGVVGASGFIGGHVARLLAEQGHAVRAFGRDRAALDRLYPGDAFERVVVPARWQDAVSDLDGLVIAVGVLDGPGLIAAHRNLPAEIVAAAETAGIAHLVLVSAVGAAPTAETAFLRTKACGEAAILAARRPGWTVIRPSLVYGPGGASMAFLAALAALPLRPSIASGGLRPIAVDDLARSIADLVTRSDALPAVLDAVGPDRVSLDAYVSALGQWLGLRGRRLPVPAGLLAAAAKLGASTGLPLMRGDALAMLRTGADGDPHPLARLTGRHAAGLVEGLARRPATPGDRTLALLGPWAEILRWALAILWIGSGFVSLAFVDRGLAILHEGWITGPVALGLVIAGGGFDLLLGIAALSRRWAGTVAYLQAATIVLYTALATWMVPAAWADPLGQLLKNVPILAATLLVASLARR